MAWALQDAKAKFSEVVKRAQTEGPQRVTVRGESAVVVIAESELNELRKKAGGAKKMTFDEFLLSGEPWPDDLVEDINNRPKDYGRDIEL